VKPQIARAILALALAAVFAATLTPGPPQQIPGIACLLCGERAVADALLNVILFLPIGIGLAQVGLPLKRTILVGGLLSAGIELSQMVIPGRDPSVSDVMMNTTGTALGGFAVYSKIRWLEPAMAAAARMSLGAGAAAAATVVATGILLRPSYPHDVYYGQWTPNLAQLDWYRGRVLEASVGGVDLPDGELAQSARARGLFLAGASLRVKAIAGPPTRRLGSVFSIADGHQRTILLVGAERNDLIIQRRTLAADLRLDQPEVRFPGVMEGISPGDTLNLSLRLDNRGFCAALNRVSDCHLGYTVGTGWRLLYSGRSFPAWQTALISLGWVAGLAFPFGFWLRVAWPSMAGAIILFAGLALVPVGTGLQPTSPWEWLAAVAGTAVGIGLRRFAPAIRDPV